MQVVVKMSHNGKRMKALFIKEGMHLLTISISSIQAPGLGLQRSVGRDRPAVSSPFSGNFRSFE